MSERVTIDGIEFWEGQKWVELYRGEANRSVYVVGWDEALKRIRIQGALKTWAQARRFNGKNGGYKRVE